MKQWTYLIFAIAILASCNNNPESGTPETPAAESTDNNLTTHTEKFVFPGEEEATYPTTYTVTWEEPKDLSTDMANALKQYYDVSMRSMNGSLIGIEAKADSFFAEYALFKESSGDLRAPAWEYKETYTIVPSADNVLTMNKYTEESKASTQTVTNSEYTNFDLETGFNIPFNRIVPDSLVDSLNSIAVDYFIDQHNVDVSKGWVNAGYTLYSGFVTNQNYILGKDSITFVYNRYEIADYPKGIIRFSVPNSAIKPIAADLSDQWLK